MSDVSIRERTPAPAAATPALVTAVRPELYDCLQVNLALLAERELGAPPLALGGRLTFAPRIGADGLPSVEPVLDDHLDAARDLLGLAVTDRRRTGDRPDPAELLGGHGTVYAVADAYHLPWVPYHGQQHMDHSFLLQLRPDGGVAVQDAYHNETDHGPARPGAWELSAAELADALPGGAQVLAFAPAPAGPAPTGYRPPAPGAVDAYVQAYREHADRAGALRRLTLETWLLSRARHLHAAHRLAVAGPSAADDPALETHLADWTRLVEQTYLAHRRIQRGRPEPAGHLDRLADLLAADPQVFAAEEPGRTSPQSDHDAALREVVAEEAAAVLRVPPAELASAAALDEVPGFSSFRMVEIVERLEDRLGIQFDPDDLLPENLHDLDRLCRIVRRAREERG